MRVEYRKLFLKDLKKLRKQPIYQQVYELAFHSLPDADELQSIANVKALVGSSDRYRIRIGNHRIGLEVSEDRVELVRVLHRKDFYRYFP